MDNQLILAIDEGGTYIKYGIVHPDGLIENVDKVRTPKDIEGFTSTLSDIINMNNENFVGVAISTPGRVMSETGAIYLGGSLPFLDGFSVKDFVESTFNIPCSAINDGKAASQAEYW